MNLELTSFMARKGGFSDTLFSRLLGIFDCDLTRFCHS